MNIRFHVFLVHLLISATVISVFFLFAYYIWYGQLYVTISGVMAPAKIMVLVDVVVGPLLTLLVYKQGKKNLKIDIGLILLLQLTAFLYGSYALYLGKPALVALNGSSFEIITQNDLRPELPNELKQQTGLLAAPNYVAVNPNKNLFNQQAHQQQAFMISLSFDDEWVKAQAASVEQISERLGLDQAVTLENLDEMKKQNLIFYPFRDAYLNAALVIKDYQPLQIIHTAKP